MSLRRNTLYSTLLIACMAGYGWLYWSLHTEQNSVSVCLFKHTTGIPCPSCGSTRSVMAITQGQYVDALHLNPLGYIITLIMLLAPLWIVFDFVTRKGTLFDFYQNMEVSLKRPLYQLPLFTLLLINWIWTLTKDL